MEKEAVIFDLDGVICSTDEYHYVAWKKIADRIGIHFDREINNQLRGISRLDSLQIILDQDPLQKWSWQEKESLAEEKNNIYQELLKNITPDDTLPGVRETLAALRKKGKKLGIGSSSRNTMIILRRLQLDHAFDVVVDGNQITHCKPDPEVYLKAAEKLHVEPSEAVIVEDAVSGAEAGYRGGFSVLCVGDAAKKYAGDCNLSDIRACADIVN